MNNAKTDLKQLLSYFKYQNKLKFVLRTNSAVGTRKESTAEHSWSVAMMSWMLTKPLEQELGVSLDQNKILKMALLHDIVEIDAGDVSAWDGQGRKAVKAGESEAIEKIKNMLPPELGSDVFELWHEHEQKNSTEAKLVKACDQLCPLIYRVTFNSGYAGTGVDRNTLDQIFLPIVSFSQLTQTLYTTLADEIETLNLFDEK